MIICVVEVDSAELKRVQKWFEQQKEDKQEEVEQIVGVTAKHIVGQAKQLAPKRTGFLQKSISSKQSKGWLGSAVKCGIQLFCRIWHPQNRSQTIFQACHRKWIGLSETGNQKEIQGGVTMDAALEVQKAQHSAIKALNYSVFDHRPQGTVTYPFVLLGEADQHSGTVKKGTEETVNSTVLVFSNYRGSKEIKGNASGNPTGLHTDGSGQLHNHCNISIHAGCGRCGKPSFSRETLTSHTKL